MQESWNIKIKYIRKGNTETCNKNCGEREKIKYKNKN